MPINPTAALSAPPRTARSSWSTDDVILYHLGIGAAVGKGKATDPDELAYTYERDLSVLPSFGVIPIMSAINSLNTFDGIELDYTKLLHGEQEIVLHRPLPVEAEVVHAIRIADVMDKGKAAVVIMEVVSSDDDGPLTTNRFTVFARGEGGFGGDPGATDVIEPSEREPDHLVITPTEERQALLYRLSGDKNLLHADPDVARRAGFDAPILHGLCTFGIVCKAAVDHALGGDVTAVASYRARFAGIVVPGETVETSIWREDDRLLLSARTTERGDPVLTNAAITLRGGASR